MNKLFIFSDEISKKMSELLRHKTDQLFTNFCMPGASATEILNKVLSKSYNSNNYYNTYWEERNYKY